MGPMAELGPQYQREKGAFAHAGSAGFSQGHWVANPDLPDARWADVWRYEDMVLPLYRAMGSHRHVDAVNTRTKDCLLVTDDLR
jgi:hypothetical protein